MHMTKSINWLSGFLTWSENFDKNFSNLKGENEFCELAYSELNKKDWSVNFNIESFLDQFYSQKTFPTQAHVHSSFGEPPFTIYSSKKNNFRMRFFFIS